jgi:hypothetical protein
MRSDRQVGQVIDALASEKRDLAAARRFYTRALSDGRRQRHTKTITRTTEDPLTDGTRVLEPHSSYRARGGRLAEAWFVEARTAWPRGLGS